MAEAKKLHRPSLGDWACDGLAEEFPIWMRDEKLLGCSEEEAQQSEKGGGDDEMQEQEQQQQPQRRQDGRDGNKYRSFLLVRSEKKEEKNPAELSYDPANVPVVLDARKVSVEEFAANYEGREIPCVIRNIPYIGYEEELDDEDSSTTGCSSSSSSGSDSDGDGNKKKSGGESNCGASSSSSSPTGHSPSLERRRQNQKQKQQQKQQQRKASSPSGGKPWPAVEKWRAASLRKNRALRDRVFKCGEDDDGDPVKVKLKHFLRYQDENRDDSPLYVFDSAFDEDKYGKSILDDYTVPSYFQDDLFNLVSESRRPPYRWFLIGPERSGTCVHVDPLATNAWNTLVEGRKRWVLFPPHVPKHVVKARGLVGDEEDDEAIHYFMYILPRIKRKATQFRDTEEYRDFACYEFTQEAGETVFIPNGWWHAVLNLTHTVGVTQNFCSPRNFDKVWTKTRTGRKRMAWKWLCALDRRYPHLADRARALNKRDSFVMKYDPSVMAKQEERKQKEKEQQQDEGQDQQQLSKRREHNHQREDVVDEAATRRKLQKVMV